MLLSPEGWQVFTYGVQVLCFGAAGGIAQGVVQLREREALEKEAAKKKGRASGAVADISPVTQSTVSEGYWLGHTLIGILGAFALVPFGIRILDLDLKPLGSDSSDFQGLLKSSLFLLSLAALGGFSGYRALSGLGKHVLDKLLKEKTERIEVEQEVIAEKTEALEHRTSEIQQDYIKQKAELALYKAKCNMSDGLYMDALANTKDFFMLHKSGVISPKDLVFGYIQQGRALKMLGRYDEALQAVGQGLKAIENAFSSVETDTKTERPPDRYHGALLYNRACYKILAESKKKGSFTDSLIDEIIGDIKEALKLIEISRQYIDKDPDFDPVRSNSRFQRFLAECIPQ
jgi:tetratricopeptide (TPR) repeat protein